MKLTRHAENIRFESGVSPDVPGTLTFDLIVRDGDDSFTYGGRSGVTAQNTTPAIRAAIDAATARILADSDRPQPSMAHSLRGLLTRMDDELV